MKIITINNYVVDVLMEALNIDMEVFDDRDSVKTKYDKQHKETFYTFNKKIRNRKATVQLEVHPLRSLDANNTDHGCYVEFYVDDSVSKRSKDDYDLRLAIEVLSYVISCIRAIHSLHPEIVCFHFTADKIHEQQYDKLLPRLAPKMNFKFDKHPWEESKMAKVLFSLSKLNPFGSKTRISVIYEVIV